MIQFNNYPFSEPASFVGWIAPFRAGIYAILVYDGTQAPKPPYKAIYFGESGNMSERGFPRSHHRYDCWVSQAGTEAHLYIAIYPMPNSTTEQRTEIESNLINVCNPICNR